MIEEKPILFQLIDMIGDLLNISNNTVKSFRIWTNSFYCQNFAVFWNCVIDCHLPDFCKIYGECYE